MFRINTMSLVGLERDREEGLTLRWLPEGFMIEMTKQKVCSYTVFGWWCSAHSEEKFPEKMYM